MKPIVLSGIRPTGFLHLGNYLGAVKNFVRMQDDYQCFFFIADWHSLTTHPDTKTLALNVYRVLAEYISSGIDIEKSCVYVQSQIPEIAELYLILNTMAYKGELEKTTSFKEKIKIHHENINAGLLTYPVLMAADILIHRAHLVPVGKDQEQHLEMTRNFAQRFNHRYGDVFPEPKAFSFEQDLVKIMGLDGNGKMSKSENEMTTIFLTDANDIIEKKIMKAKTDSGPTQANSPMPDYILNLFTILKHVAPQDIYTKYLTHYNECTIRYGDFKKQLAASLIEFLTPIRTQTLSLLDDKPYLDKVIKRGTEKARESAAQTIAEVKKAMYIRF